MNASSTGALNRATGIALIAGSILALAFMLHHPSTSAGDLAAALAEISAEGKLSAWVHGLLMVTMTGIWFGTYGLAVCLGTSRPLPVLGFMLFGLGTLAYLLAASVSGFIVPAIGADYAGSPAAEMEHAHALLDLAGTANQVFANAGVIATAAGILAWSISLALRPGSGRWIGVFGIAVSILPALMLLTGHLRLHVTGMTLVVAAHGAWYLLAGWYLAFGQGKSPG
jgi:hypothetical protein